MDARQGVSEMQCSEDRHNFTIRACEEHVHVSWRAALAPPSPLTCKDDGCCLQCVTLPIFQLIS